MLRICVIESPGFSINDGEKSLRSQVPAKEWNNNYILPVMWKSILKKIKDLNKKTWNDEIAKENRNTSKDWKGERFIVLFYPEVQKYRKHKQKKKKYITWNYIKLLKPLHGTENN